jgi:peptide/nickel transport system substrate-binding protein
MPKREPVSEKNPIRRRRLLQSLGAVGVAGLAGCSGAEDSDSSGTSGDNSNVQDDQSQDAQNQDNQNQGLGERVPTQTLAYWGGRGGFTSMMEGSTSIFKKSAEQLGVTIERSTVEYLPHVNRAFNDERTANFFHWLHNTTPDRLDPHTFNRRYAIDWAGADGSGNPQSYASCEFSIPALQQARAPDTETRQQIVNEAQSILSADKAIGNMAPYIAMGAARTDQVDVSNVGEAGFHMSNGNLFMNSSPTNSNQIVANTTPALVNNLNYVILDSVNVQAAWNLLFSHPLVRRDENYELENGLASSVEIENNAQQFVVELKDGTTFHNGDPLTSEDVKFTFEYLNQFGDQLANASTAIPYDSIEIIDDRTTQFNLTDSYLPLYQRTMVKWGILHQPTWQEAMDQGIPNEFSPGPDLVGSGPFQLANFDQGTSMTLTPFEDFVGTVPDYDLTWQVYQNTQTVFQAFRNNEVQIMTDINADIAERVEQQMGNNTQVSRSGGTLPFVIYPWMSHGAPMFHAFRDAVYRSINRERINQVVFNGLTETPTHCSSLQPPHPSAPPKDVLTEFGPVEGDVEGARQILEEAGWGWDDNGNLHYPADADLTPPWPQGEQPSPDDYPCLNEDGEVREELLQLSAETTTSS